MLFEGLANTLAVAFNQLCLIFHKVSANSPTLKHSRRGVRMGGGSEGLGPTRRLACKLLLLLCLVALHGEPKLHTNYKDGIQLAL